MSNPPALHAPRLILQPLHTRHSDGLYAIYHDERAMVYWHTPPHVARAETTRMIEYMLYSPGYHQWAVMLRESGQVIGQVGYLGTAIPGMGYIIHPDFHGQGYGAEAVSAALDHGFVGLALNRVELWIHAHNTASVRLAQRLGFRQRGQFTQRYAHLPTPHETLVYGLRADEWAVRAQQTPANARREVACYGVSPVLVVADVDLCVRFYLQDLGFELEYADEGFAIVARGEWSSERIQLHIEHSASPPPPGELYFRLSDVDALHAEFRQRGAPLVQPPLTQPYGRREFTVTDPAGWRLRFSAAV